MGGCQILKFLRGIRSGFELVRHQRSQTPAGRTNRAIQLKRNFPETTRICVIIWHRYDESALLFQLSSSIVYVFLKEKNTLLNKTRWEAGRSSQNGRHGGKAPDQVAENTPLSECHISRVPLNWHQPNHVRNVGEVGQEMLDENWFQSACCSANLVGDIPFRSTRRLTQLRRWKTKSKRTGARIQFGTLQRSGDYPKWETGQQASMIWSRVIGVKWL